MATKLKKSTGKKTSDKSETKKSSGGRPRPGLGRGLGALIQSRAEDSVPAPPTTQKPTGQSVVEVAVEMVARSPWQPRHSFESAALAELTESIKAHGVIQPLICRMAADGYQLIAGERRLRAAVDAGLATVPVVVVEAADRDAAEMAIVENIQREDLNVIEEAEGYRLLADSFGLTQQEVAERVGKARASVANAMRLLELPDEVKQLVSAGMLSAGHAKVILSLPEETEQVLLARRCVTEGQTVRALERIIQRRQADRLAATERKTDIPATHLNYLLEKLHRLFQTQVRLQPTVTHANGRRSKGTLEIDFYDNRDLDRLLAILGVELD